jgi:hypothetical protein
MALVAGPVCQFWSAALLWRAMKKNRPRPNRIIAVAAICIWALLVTTMAVASGFWSKQ